ncbi:hypothetical protein DITRI_Ditri05aG0012900 [Diplodiscus trichospermus]
MAEGKNGNKKGGNGEKKKKGSSTIVVYVSCLCDGCAPKILNYIHQVEGVETVKADSSSNEVTVIGAVDPKAIVERLRTETKKKIELISPQPKKDDNKKEKKHKKNKNEGGKDGGGGKGKNNNNNNNNKGGNGGGDGGNEANVDGATMEYVVQRKFGYMLGYHGYMHAYLGYGHPGYGYGHRHSHPHRHG